MVLVPGGSSVPYCRLKWSLPSAPLPRGGGGSNGTPSEEGSIKQLIGWPRSAYSGRKPYGGTDYTVSARTSSGTPPAHPRPTRQTAFPTLTHSLWTLGSLRDVLCLTGTQFSDLSLFDLPAPLSIICFVFFAVELRLDKLFRVACETLEPKPTPQTRP